MTLQDQLSSTNKSDEPALLPRPKELRFGGGIYQGNLNCLLTQVDGLEASSMQAALGEACPVNIRQDAGEATAEILLSIGETGIASASPEAYRLSIGPEQIRIIGKSAEGVIMGLRTLSQLIARERIPQCEIADWPDMRLRVAHLCYGHVRETMPYNTPNFTALLEQIDRLAALKYNGVLLELTALFPFRRHPLISYRLAFTPEQIAELRDRQRLHHLRPIPMLQALGHVYDILLHEEYASYRETPDRTQQFCPTNPRVADLYMELIEEYLEAFPESESVHLGGDEARQMGQCPRCREKANTLGMARLYTDHMVRIGERLWEKGIRPLIWSDMLENHREGIELLPKFFKIIYWNYDLPNWHMPYAVEEFMQAGFEVICAPAVRWGAAGTELSVYYPESLRGIETLVPRAYADGCRETIVTNWMKGSPHELADYGFAYAADISWNSRVTREDFQTRYAGVAFGLERDVCEAYDLLSLPLPYAEAVCLHMPDRLNRLDVSGLRFAEKWAKYGTVEQEATVLAQLEHGAKAAEQATKLLSRLDSAHIRDRRQFELLRLAAECIQAKARFGLALHGGNNLSTTELLKWCAEYPAVLGGWKAAKKRHFEMLLKTGFPPVIELLNEMMFEPAEIKALVEMGKRVAAMVSPGKTPAEVAIPFLDNAGGSYERGVQHGRVFREQIHHSITTWRPNWPDDAANHPVKKRMFDYTQRRFPAIIDELNGIADGAGLTLDEIFWLNIFNAAGRVSVAGCSTIIARGCDGAVHLGKTSDIDAEQRRMMLLRRVRDAGRDFYVIGWVGTVWVEVALTSSGLALGANSAPPQPGQTGDGLGQHFGAYPVLFAADTVEQAIAEFANIDYAGKGQVYGLADASGNAAIVEKSGTAQGVIRLQPGEAGMVGVNDYYSDAMREFNRPPGDEFDENCRARRAGFERWLATDTGSRPVLALKELLSAGPFCQTGQCGLYTEAAAIVSPRAGEMRVTGLPPSARAYANWRFNK